MLFPVRPLLFVPVLAFLCFAPLLILAQTSIDDVHITPRDHPLSPGALEAVTASPGGLLRAKVDLVLVPVSITDDNAQPVLGLERENFQLYENKKPQQIRDFSSEDAPISVGIIVDSSGSMQNKLDWAREAVRQFCETANPADEFFLVTFSDQPQIATDFTTNTDEIETSRFMNMVGSKRQAVVDSAPRRTQRAFQPGHHQCKRPQCKLQAAAQWGLVAPARSAAPAGQSSTIE